MFSKSRINEPGPKAGEGDKPKTAEAPMTKPSTDFTPTAPKGKAGVSVLSADLTVVGNLRTSGDIQVEGTVEGDIRAHLLTVGESATIRGEIVADDIVVNGRVIGKVRGLKVRLTSSARVEGDIIHKTIAIESGAHFEGSVQRQEDPLAQGRTALPPPTATTAAESV
ncbi:MAG: polymer-forming cytoskeletal protein [bacterium]